MFRYSFIFFTLLIAFLIPGEVLAQQRTDDMQLGIEYFRNREYEKAVNIFEKLYDANPTQATYHYYFTCLLELNDYRKAERIARQQVRTNPNSPRYRIDLGFVYMSSGDLSKGIKEYEDVIKTLQANQRDINEAANAFIVRRENEYAVKTYLKGRELLGGSYGFHMELGNLYDRMGNFEKMTIEFLSQLRDENSNVAQIQNRFQNALMTDTDNKRAQFLRVELLRNIRQHPDVIAYTEMMLWLAIQQKDFESAYTQATALDRRFNEGGSRVYALAQLALANHDYDVAIKSYEYLIRQGEMSHYYIHSRIEILNASNQQITSQHPVDQDALLKLEKRYLETLDELGKNRFTLPLMRDLANLYAYKLYNTDKAIAILNDALQIRGIGQMNQAECKLDLADILLYTGDVWDATLLYSQVEKDFPHEPIGHEAKFRNARLSFFIGEFDWARAQLNVLKAATSKLIANDAMALSLLIKDNMDIDSTYYALTFFSRAMLHSYQNRDDLAMQTLDSLVAQFPYHPILDNVHLEKAEIYIRSTEYDKAVFHLEQVVQFFPYGLLADKALFRLAEVYEVYLGDREKAMEFYKELLLQYPASLQADPARQRFRSLRGDVI